MPTLWTPTAEHLADAKLTRFIAQVRGLGGDAAEISDYDSLHRWSTVNLELFWLEVRRFCGILAGENDSSVACERPLIGRSRVAPPNDELGPKWFLGTRLNFAQNLLRYADDREALVFWNERGRQRSLTYGELNGEVARVARALRGMGVKAGARVAGFLPNLPETVIAMLATTSIGAIWSSCSPDFGVNGVLDRFGQIEPRVLFVADGYLYSGRDIDCLARVKEIAEKIPAIEHVVVIPYMRDAPDLEGIRNATLWASLGGASADASAIEFAHQPFDHPGYIMFSSGTTGLPKCMVHGAGGTLLQHLKELVLHTDLTRDDRSFFFTTCGWMMWNWLVSALAIGSTLVLYDGSPSHPDGNALWNLADEVGITVFGTSAKWIAATEKAGVKPRETHKLLGLKSILSTGSPLAAHSFDYVYSSVKRDVRVSSISGGTDIISCFAGGNPIGPVWRGELQALAL